MSQIVTLAVPGITCGGCVKRATQALQGHEGVQSTDVKVGRAKVEFDPAITSIDAVKATMAAAGYPVARVEE